MSTLANQTAVPHFALTSEERLQLALDAKAIAGTWYWDVQQDHFTADARFARYFSLDVETMRHGTRLAEVIQSIYPEDEPKVRRLISDALDNGGPYCAEYRVQQLDGSYHWIEANGHVTHDAEGRPVSFPGVLIDIDARKRRELYQDALIALGDRLRDLRSEEEIAVASAQVCARVLQIARAGYGAIDGLGTNVRVVGDWCVAASVDSLLGPCELDDVGMFLDELSAGQTVAIEDVRTDARIGAKAAAALAPTQVRSLLNVPLMHEGRLVGVFIADHFEARRWRDDEIAFVRGLADRTWAAIVAVRALDQMRRVNADLEREVRQRAADRNLLWRISGDLMLVAHFDARIVAVNPAWHKRLGWSDQELVGHSFLDLIHPDDLARTIDAATAVRHGTSFPVFENRYRCKDGSYRHIAWSAGPAEDVLVATGRDVTDVRAQQDLLQQAEEKLRQSQKMEAVGQLTGGIAHDFNNLLTIISTSVQLLRRSQPEERRHLRLIDAISGAVSHASKLTGQLLAFARKQSLQPVVFDARRNILDMREMVQTLVGARVSVHVDGDADPYWVDADPGQFDTAIVNMVANARDAMDSAGHIEITLERVAAMPAMRQHAPVEGDFIAVSVIDTGAGIAVDQLEKVFDPFFTTKPVGQGTGLGLSQVFGFAKQSGGDVQVRSELGRGTTFTLYLPLAARQQASASALAAQTASVSGSGKILLVEDNHSVATVARAALEDMGYTVHACDSGAEALEVIAQASDQFVALFTDVMMAGIDGIALAREVRSRYPELPILLASGYSSVLASSEDRGFPLVAKPYGLDQLKEALQKAIDSHRHR